MQHDAEEKELLSEQITKAGVRRYIEDHDKSRQWDPQLKVVQHRCYQPPLSSSTNGAAASSAAAPMASPKASPGASSAGRSAATKPSVKKSGAKKRDRVQFVKPLNKEKIGVAARGPGKAGSGLNVPPESEKYVPKGRERGNCIHIMDVVLRSKDGK